MQKLCGFLEQKHNKKAKQKKKKLSPPPFFFLSTFFFSFLINLSANTWHPFKCTFRSLLAILLRHHLCSWPTTSLTCPIWRCDTSNEWQYLFWHITCRFYSPALSLCYNVPTPTSFDPGAKYSKERLSQIFLTYAKSLF